MTKLKPCPFCGGEATIRDYNGLYVECRNCHVRTPPFMLKHQNKAIEVWNNRSSWHTGTPTEEGLYLICSPSWDMFPSKYNVAEFDGKDFVYAEGMHQIVVRTNPITVAWQKIEPYKEKDK